MIKQIENINYKMLENVNYDSSKNVYFVSFGDIDHEFEDDEDFGPHLFPGVEGTTVEEVEKKNRIYKSIDKNFGNRELGTWIVEDLTKVINNVYADFFM